VASQYSNLSRLLEVCDIEGWGATARTEAQWCHPIETSEIAGILNALTSWNIVPCCESVLARALIVIWQD